MYDVGEDVGRLAAMLEALDGEAMRVAAVDGYLTALALFREHVPTAEWMAQVWSEDARFESVQEAELKTALIRHYDSIAHTLSSEPENYGPVLQENETTGELIWDEWVLGLEYAARLRPAAWKRIEACTEPDVVGAVEMLEILYGAVSGEFGRDKEGIAPLGRFPPVLICGIVRDLNERGRSKGAGAAERVEARVSETVGANSEPDQESGCALKRAHHRLSGIN